MRSQFSTFLMLLVCIGPLGAEQTAPTPGAQQKKFEIAVGEWAYKGTTKETVFGPAGSFEGKETCRMTLGGFFFESRWRDRSDDGSVAEGLVLQWYDLVSNTYRASSFDNDGSATSGATTFENGRWTTLGSRTGKGGKSCDVRFISDYAADGKSRTGAAEYSSDGQKTWLPWWKLTAIKVGN